MKAIGDMKENKSYPICRECKWNKRGSDRIGQYDECRHPKNVDHRYDKYHAETVLVSGIPVNHSITYRNAYCTEQRRVMASLWNRVFGYTSDICGKQGNWFERKDPDEEEWLETAGDPNNPHDIDLMT
jgi:hypothetical protein